MMQKVFSLVVAVSYVACGPVADPKADPLLYAHPLAYHHHVPLCKTTLETKTIERCHLEPERVCETKTQTYTKITGYEKGDCKEIEVCKPVWRKRRSASPHGYLLPACEKVTKEICKQVPTTEEISKDIDLCKLSPKKVCLDVEVKVPKLDCGEEELAAEEEAPAEE